MQKPLTLFIAMRYLRAKKRNHFISFISLISIVGITLGVMVLITVLSVMNGFDQQIKTRLFGIASQMTISGMSGSLSNWQSLADRVKENKQVTDIAPFISGQGVLTSQVGGVNAVGVLGIAPKYEEKVTDVNSKMVSGSLDDLKPGKFDIILGDKLADNLGVVVGDKVVLMIPQATLTPAALLPTYKRFTVAGIFKIGNGFAFDSQLAFINIHDAQKLYRLGDAVSGIRLKLTDLYLAPILSKTFQHELPANFDIRNWSQTYGNFFDAIRLEKTMMFIILLLIVAVAAFNLVSTLVMVVNDKRADIAILRTLGATPRNILHIFIFQGFIVGMMGTLVGLGGGLLLASNVTSIVNWLEKLFHVQLFASSVYFVNYLPSKIEFSDVMHVCLIAFLMSLVATLYPAWRAAKTQPAEALRYE